MKKVSIYWSPLAGLLTVAIQTVTFYIRFQRPNAGAAFVDYLLFFIAGTLGGLILLYFLNKQTTKIGWWGVLVAFLFATPVAMLFMLGGGLLGWIGVLLFPLLPWALVTWIGSLVGRMGK